MIIQTGQSLTEPSATTRGLSCFSTPIDWSRKNYSYHCIAVTVYSKAQFHISAQMSMICRVLCAINRCRALKCLWFWIRDSEFAPKCQASLLNDLPLSLKSLACDTIEFRVEMAMHIQRLTALTHLELRIISEKADRFEKVAFNTCTESLDSIICQLDIFREAQWHVHSYIQPCCLVFGNPYYHCIQICLACFSVFCECRFLS